MESVIVGVLSGLISPIVLLLIQHKLVWAKQRSLELKYNIFQESVRALSLWSTDALSPELQSNKPSYKGVQPVTHARPDTWESIEKARGLVRAFFSLSAYEAFDAATKAKISIDNIPNEDFEQKRLEAILAMAKELGLDVSA